ncbi:MAG: ECF transporter S component [Butyricicoccaceae bacterium]
MNNKMDARFLCSTAMMAAVVCVMTMVIQIPIPLGYAHLGDAFILLTVAFLGKRAGFWAGGIGSAMADLLTGYTQWVIPTFVIKSLMALIAGKLMYDENEECRLTSVRGALGAVVSMAWMVLGYVVSGAALNGSIAAGLASAPGLMVKGVLNIAVFYAVGMIFERANVRKLLQAK